MANEDVSKLIDDLRTLPGIVGNMGKSIANAQHLLNVDYLRTVQVYLRAIRSLPPEAQKPDFIRDLLRDVAPPRYQFTETSLDFRADLFESEELAGRAEVGAGFNMGMGAVALSFSGSYGSRSDYRAAARIATTLHAIPSNETTLNKMLDRVAGLQQIALPAPPAAGAPPLGPESQLGEHLAAVTKLLEKK